MTDMQRNLRDAQRLAAAIRRAGGDVFRVDSNPDAGFVYIKNNKNVGVNADSVFNGRILLPRGELTASEIAAVMLETGAY